MTISKHSISVAMCTYNGATFIRQQLDSIAAQTRLPDELVICDDGSSDSTPQIVENFASAVTFPVRWVRNSENLGSTKNFERAMSLCTGDLIALSDQDDIWMPEKLACQAGMFECDPVLGGVFSDAELVDEQSSPLHGSLWAGFHFPPKEQERFERGGEVAVLLKRNVVTGATLMIRARLTPLFSPIPSCWQHDGWIAWMIVLYSKLRLIKTPLIRYRIHGNQQIGIESIARSRSLSFRGRLELGKREELAKNLLAARELDELAKRLAETSDPARHPVLPELQNKSAFLTARGAQYGSPLSRTLTILKHTRDYHRYESGWKWLLRDIAISFL
jgi:hypothetical protein